MTPRACALLLRYVAALVLGEELAHWTRRALRDCGLTDDAIDAAVQRVRAAMEAE